jgi:septin family protein
LKEFSSNKLISSDRKQVLSQEESEARTQEEQDKRYHELLYYKTDFVATYSMMETKYKFNA